MSRDKSSSSRAPLYSQIDVAQPSYSSPSSPARGQDGEQAHLLRLLLASQDRQNELRINVVASGVVQDAYEKYKDFFPGHNPVPMYKVVNAYVRSP